MSVNFNSCRLVNFKICAGYKGCKACLLCLRVGWVLLTFHTTGMVLLYRIYFFEIFFSVDCACRGLWDC